jgi:PQQ-like domain
MGSGTAQRLLLVSVAAVLALAGLLGCGNSSGDGSTGAASGSTPLVNWPLFGRIPERTHYLPFEGRDLDPPLHEAWSINTHALIEFPPALANGVAYVANKYGNVRAVRLRDRKTIWERVTDRRLSGPPTFVTAPVYHRGHVFLAFLDGELVAVNAISGKTDWKRNLHAHLESSPLAVDGSLYLGDDRTNLVSLRASDGRVRWQFNSPGAIKASPSYHDVMGASTPRQRSPSVTSTPPATMEPSTPSTKRPARSPGSFRPTTSSTARPPSPMCPAPRPASTSVATTSTSTPQASRPAKRFGIDVRSHKETFHLEQAGYTPVVSDGRRLFAVGYFTLVGLEPTEH